MRRKGVLVDLQKMAERLEVINIQRWLEDNKAFFLPPVCNKLMYAGQLKVMFIGGPNQRKDYHIEEGEELFFQFRGDMVLKIVEKGEHKDVVIKEGEIYLHPSRIPHSPQRYENTVGLVIERERSLEERDGLRYYVEGSTDPLWEEWFHCYDLGTQLAPVIKTFFASEEYRTGQPPQGKVFPPPPINIDTTTATNDPFTLKKWLADNDAEIRSKGRKVLFENGEFKVVVWGEGVQEAQNAGEAFLWQLEGESEVSCGRGSGKMEAHCCTLMQAGEKFTVKYRPGSVAVTVTTDPLANKPKA